MKIRTLFQLVQEVDTIQEYSHHGSRKKVFVSLNIFRMQQDHHPTYILGRNKWDEQRIELLPQITKPSFLDGAASEPFRFLTCPFWGPPITKKEWLAVECRCGIEKPRGNKRVNMKNAAISSQKERILGLIFISSFWQLVIVLPSCLVLTFLCVSRMILLFLKSFDLSNRKESFRLWDRWTRPKRWHGRVLKSLLWNRSKENF